MRDGLHEQRDGRVWGGGGRACTRSTQNLWCTSTPSSFFLLLYPSASTDD